MPLYDFSCDRCGQQKEVLVFFEEEMPCCDKCQGPMTKLLSAPALLKVGISSHEQWLSKDYQPQGRPVTRREPLPHDMGQGIKVYDMEFGHQEREMLNRKSELDNV